jgi:hypothetical protein
MRILFKTVCLLIFSCFIQSSFADLSIYQQMEDSQTSPVTTEEMRIYISGNRIRLDQGQKISSIILKDKKATYSIMHESRQYIVLPHDESLKDNFPLTKTDDIQIENTGKTEQIHGYPCKLLKIKEKNGDLTELMISDKVLDVNVFYKEFQSFLEFGFGPVARQLEKHPELKGIPIRVTEFRGIQKFRQSTLMRVETTKILDSVFEVPAGYEELKMPGH